MTAPGCHRPGACPVPGPSGVDLRHVRTVALGPGTGYHTASWARHWPSLFNTSGRGDARFSPLPTPKGPVLTLYGARSQTAALLETVFHDVHGSASRVVTRMDLAGRNLVHFELPERLVLYDLRDGALARLALQRRQLVSTSAAHYPCTREWAEVLHGRRGVGSARPVGIVWHSRVAELAKAGSALLGDLLQGQNEEVFVLFGDRLPTVDRGPYSATQSVSDLSSRKALPLVTAVAEQLGATLA